MLSNSSFHLSFRYALCSKTLALRASDRSADTCLPCTALEAAQHGVPVVLSTSSGAGEVLRRGSLKVDFWDVELMANMIVAVLRSPSLAEMLRRESAEELRESTWDRAARSCVDIYHKMIEQGGAARVPSELETMSAVGV